MVGLVITIATWAFPRGDGPADAFHPNPTAAPPSISALRATAFRLFDPKAVSVERIRDFGSDAYAACRASRVIATSGAYSCVEVTEVGGSAIGVYDPCFGESSNSVLCVTESGGYARAATREELPTLYRSTVESITSRYPWRIQLESGTTCVWDWYRAEDRGSNDEDLWTCGLASDSSDEHSNGAMVQPTYDGHLFGNSPETDPLAFDGIFIMDFGGLARALGSDEVQFAVDIDFTDRTRWTVLVKTAGGEYHVEEVEVADF